MSLSGLINNTDAQQKKKKITTKFAKINKELWAKGATLQEYKG
jgi:hypothetical protein